MSKLSAKEKTFFENKLDKIRERVDLESNLDESDEFQLKTPKQIFEYLDRFVVGQDQAKRILSVCAHNHYKRLLIYRNSNFEKRLEKTNMLMLGPTGSGKTYLVKKLAECLGVPCYIADASQLTAAGYVGKDVDSLVEGLINSCNGNYDAAATGIIFIDEFDKIAKRKGGSKTKDVGGEAVQQGLLKLIEGTQVEIEKQQGLTKIKMSLDTSNILVIVGGAFVEIEEVINKRLKTGPTTSIGFNIKPQEEQEVKQDILQYVTPEDIEQFGFIPELLGRLPLIAALKELTENDLLNILTIAEGNLVEQYTTLFDFSNTKLNFETDALTEIAKTAKTLKTGARSLKTILETVLLDKMFDLEDANITKDYVDQKIQARLHSS